jgi:S1-C subfamily serine protease
MRRQEDDGLMLRSLILAAIVLAMPCVAASQETGVLHIKVVLVDPERGVTPVARHRLLISDNPATAAPRLIVTGADGTADVKLRPGNYTVESDRPTTFRGKAYQWTQALDVFAGRDAVLELNAANAEIDTAATSTATDDAPPLEADPSYLLTQWQDSVVAVWTPAAHASGFVIDRKGLIATNQKVVGTATSVEVQMTPTIKVKGTVLAADPAKDVAIIRVDPSVVASARPMSIGCGQTAAQSVAQGSKIFTISSPLHAEKDIAPGRVNRVDPGRIVSDLDSAPSGAGGPVFTTEGTLVGITTVIDAQDAAANRDESPVVRIENACEVVAAAENNMAGAAPPSAEKLPVEPAQPIPLDALKEAASRRAGSLSPYQVSSASFDVGFITPVMIYGVQNQGQQAGRPTRGGAGRMPAAVAGSTLMWSVMDFANWSEYVDTFPPVLLVRITPKQVERFWTTVARGAAQTQGVSIPAIKHFNGSFLRMRAFCGDTEVTPIHPFKLEQHASETEVVYEGLYAFGPDQLGPQCGTVKLTMYSEKEPEKEDTRVIDARIVQQIAQDFASYRRP